MRESDKPSAAGAPPSPHPRILFVDDEAAVLDGLRRSMHSMRREWEVEFALGGEAGLATLAAQPFDVVVTDMRMPKVDGAAVLRAVRTKSPRTVRMVLSGYSERESLLRAINEAHRYLMKPCTPEFLRDAITRALRLRGLLCDPTVSDLVSGLDGMPTPPKLFHEISAAVADANRSVRQVGELVGKDLGLSAKVLQIVNSAMFAASRQITTTADAAVMLGMDTVRAVVLCAAVYAEFPSAPEVTRLHEHSLRVGTLSRRIAVDLKLDKQATSDAFTAGILHDIGRLILACRRVKDWQRCADPTQSANGNRSERETAIFGATHQAVGAYLLSLWGLSEPAVEAVLHMHSPSRSTSRVIAPLTAVHVADALDDEGGADSDSELDVEYLKGLGLDQKVAAWRDEFVVQAGAGKHG